MGTRHTMVHDRFQAVCLNGCGHIVAYPKLVDAIQSAKESSLCVGGGLRQYDQEKHTCESVRAHPCTKMG